MDAQVLILVSQQPGTREFSLCPGLPEARSHTHAGKTARCTHLSVNMCSVPGARVSSMRKGRAVRAMVSKRNVERKHYLNVFSLLKMVPLISRGF